MKKFFVAACCSLISLTAIAQESSILIDGQIEGAKSVMQTQDSEATFVSAPQDNKTPAPADVPEIKTAPQATAPAQESAAPVVVEEGTVVAQPVVDQAQPLVGSVIDGSVIDGGVVDGSIVGAPVDGGVVAGPVVSGGCSSCGQVAAPAPVVSGYAPVVSGCSSCGQAVAPAPVVSGCNTGCCGRRVIRRPRVIRRVRCRTRRVIGSRRRCSSCCS